MKLSFLALPVDERMGGGMQSHYLAPKGNDRAHANGLDKLGNFPCRLQREGLCRVQFGRRLRRRQAALVGRPAT